MWDQATDWADYAALIIRSTWDYQDKVQAFLAWVDSVPCVVFNDPSIISWNVDKIYLEELSAAGLSVVPSTFLTDLSSPFTPPPGKFVVKPAISAGSKDTAVYDEDRVITAHDHVRRLLRDGRKVMLQPYLSRVDSEGETAIIFVDGKMTHAMRKDALLDLDQPLEAALFRQEHMSLITAEDDVVEIAERAMTYVAARFGVPLYARVDILRGDDGRPMLSELELIEPSLFLDFHPPAATALARALGLRLAAAR